MIHFTLPARQTGKSHFVSAASVIDPPPMTPSAYLRLRREAAGLTIAQVAARLPTTHIDADMAASVIRSLETPGARARHRATLAALRTVFAFDIDIYQQLATEPAARHSQICRGCGCSTDDACVEADGHTCCGWALPTLCTRCMAHN